MFSGRLERLSLTAPMVFVAVGVVLGTVAAPGLRPGTATVTALTEATLAWVLFSDASRVGLRELRHDAGVFGRLLGVGLPLTVAAGGFAAWWLLGLPDPWLALLVGAALAPTDAALGAVVVTNPVVPARIRRVLNVESGLNDGIVTPVVMLALAGAAAAEGHGGSELGALVQLAGGTAVGAAAGAGGGILLRTAGRRDWAQENFAGPAVLALALLAYAGAVSLHTNGFVAAFAAGLAFGHFAGRGGPKEVFYLEQTAGLASLLVWMIFGAVAVPRLPALLDLPMILYALLSLTVIRMIPVAISLAGTGLGVRTVLFVGWFGPRGLASIVFALIAVEELSGTAEPMATAGSPGGAAEPVVAVIVLTVLLSVVAHGFTAGPLATRYGRREVA
ncbi:cation:proton antiporter [Actinoplanes missouriensis]|uniref:cation:proton antiporter domain-containing protein n=1 Tax=Actinoplanes missouriensis TaxID=1866 RepID=UPI0033E92876